MATVATDTVPGRCRHRHHHELMVATDMALGRCRHRHHYELMVATDTVRRQCRHRHHLEPTVDTDTVLGLCRHLRRPEHTVATDTDRGRCRRRCHHRVHTVATGNGHTVAAATDMAVEKRRVAIQSIQLPYSLSRIQLPYSLFWCNYRTISFIILQWVYWRFKGELNNLMEVSIHIIADWYIHTV